MVYIFLTHQISYSAHERYLRVIYGHASTFYSRYGFLTAIKQNSDAILFLTGLSTWNRSAKRLKHCDRAASMNKKSQKRSNFNYINV